MSAGPRRIANVGSLSAVNPTIDSYIEKKRAMEERARQIKEERANMKPGLGLPCNHDLALPPMTPTAYQTRGASLSLSFRARPSGSGPTGTAGAIPQSRGPRRLPVWLVVIPVELVLAAEFIARLRILFHKVRRLNFAFCFVLGIF